MKSKIVLFLFALPFFGIGVWMAWSVVDSIISAADMKTWVVVDARLERGGYETRDGDDVDTYEAYAEYSYRYHGTDYRGDRVAISPGADNVGSFQTRIGSDLAGAERGNRTITVYVDPDAPANSVVNRDLRWELLGFKSIFLFAFGGIGLGMMVFSIRSKAAREANEADIVNRPWLANPAWNLPVLRSSSRSAMYFTWGIAGLWCLVSAPLPFVIYDELLHKENYLGLLGLLFPIVGIGLIYWAVVRTREWKRFGPTPLTMDPFPGSIGGHVGGVIDINAAFDSVTEFSVTLSCIHSYMSGSGDDRSRSESAQWQDSQIVHAEAAQSGSRLRFRFDVPKELRESDAVQSGDNYYLWRLNVSAELSGADFDRAYEIPVYATAKSSSIMSERAVQRAKVEQDKRDGEIVRSSMDFVTGMNGTAIRFATFRNPAPGIVGSLFGAVFSGAAWFLLSYAGEYAIGGVFGLVGGLILVFSLYSLVNSLEVRQAGNDVVTIRRVLGFSIATRTMNRNDIVQLSKSSSMQTQSGGKHVRYYSIFAHDRNGRKMVVGDGFKGSNAADAAIRIIARQLGIEQANERSNYVSAPGDINFLAAE